MQQPASVGTHSAGKRRAGCRIGKTSAGICVELLKALRLEWYTKHRMDSELGLKWATARRWLPELEANGLIVSRIGDKAYYNNRSAGRVVEYAVARAWGGRAEGL